MRSLLLLLRLVLLCLLAACGDNTSGPYVTTGQDAAELAAQAACDRLNTCAPDNGWHGSYQECLATGITRYCSVIDCGAPYARLDALLDCIDAFYDVPCLTTSRPKVCVP